MAATATVADAVKASRMKAASGAAAAVAVAASAAVNTVAVETGEAARAAPRPFNPWRISRHWLEQASASRRAPFFCVNRLSRRTQACLQAATEPAMFRRLGFSSLTSHG